MITSKLTSKAQTTIPRPVRVALNLKEGDQIGFEIEGDRVLLSKIPPGTDRDDPFRTFDEWASEEDRTAYADL